MEQTQLLNVAETAAALRLKESTIRAWILTKRIAYVKVGRRVFVRRSDVVAFIAASVVYPNAEPAKLENREARAA
jgi:excisionase family DNA binding protein